jgi:bifunctional non-homologous end joining protein LigD
MELGAERGRYRLAVYIEPTGIRILTRSGHDWTHRFPDFAEVARRSGRRP